MKKKEKREKKRWGFFLFFSFSCGNNKFILNMRRGITSFPVYVLTYVYFTMICRVFHNVLSSECTPKSLGRNLVKRIHMICMYVKKQAREMKRGEEKKKKKKNP